MYHDAKGFLSAEYALKIYDADGKINIETITIIVKIFLIF
jgi:hypothetical protein